MGKIFKGLAILAGVGMAGAALYLKMPGPAAFDAAAAIRAASQYDARIIRDSFGVPHIYGARDADVAFGLAYAHAEDDWKTFEEVLFFSRGTLAARNGKDAAITDYLIQALGISESINTKYASDLSAETRTLVEAYAAGVNLYCAEDRKRCAPGAAPVTGQDIVAGFVSRTPFFYGLEEQLAKIFDGDIEIAEAAAAAREAFLKAPRDFETGSNAMAVSPSRSADGHTRLMVNSHQPYEGPVAWYEARVKSDEGWDMIGGLFPGAPLILHGAGPDLGWAFTVNKPDLVDVFHLTVDNQKKPKRYFFDGAWRDFAVKKIKFRVKLFGPFSLPVTRRGLRSVHGPVFVTDDGAFAVSYGGAGDIRAVEQWYRMDKAKNFADWTAAMEMLAIPSFNVVYADGGGTIAFYYNAAIPVRRADIDWSKAQPGDQPALLWNGVRPFSAVPSVVNPASGYVVNANHPPFEASGAGDNPDPDDYPAHYGIDTRTTNRGIRLQKLYGGDPEITAEEFVAYKFDHRYDEQSRVMALVRGLLTNEAARADAQLAPALSLLENWDGSVAKDNRAAALAVLTAQKAKGYLLDGENAETPDPAAALRDVMQSLEAGFGRIDPEWGEVVQLKRGDLALPLNGGPDTVRAVYPGGEPSGGAVPSVGGDTYILYADWAGPRDVKIKTIHQYGAATSRKDSPHYSDQAPIFAAEQWKTPPMELEALLNEATADYRPGKD